MINTLHFHGHSLGYMNNACTQKQYYNLHHHITHIPVLRHQYVTQYPILKSSITSSIDFHTIFLSLYGFLRHVHYKYPFTSCDYPCVSVYMCVCDTERYVNKMKQRRDMRVKRCLLLLLLDKEQKYTCKGNHLQVGYLYLVLRRFTVFYKYNKLLLVLNSQKALYVFNYVYKPFPLNVT